MPKAPAELLQTYRRDQIVNAAREAIGEHGYEHTSMDQIAKHAGLSRSTVYEYFSSKEEILRGSFAAHREQLGHELERCLGEASTTLERLTAFFEVCLASVDEHREYFVAVVFPLSLDEPTRADGPGGADFAGVVQHFYETVDRILDEGVARGEFPGPVQPTDRACLGTLIVGAMGTRGRLAAAPPAHEAAAQFAHFALNGLGLSPIG
ncbi:MAG: TetR/AcrR family transcriptional regulator [Candidatus Binatia bacterium]|nr:TetR/AcrR family transcriptional regulator [Candidatus Binatia bacterium]